MNGANLIPLANAARVTCRTVGVLKSWQKLGCFGEDEWVVDTARVQGSGHPIVVSLEALRREHVRHGGTEWHPELAHARNLPAHMTGYVQALRDRVQVLEGELARLKTEGAKSLAHAGALPVAFDANLTMPSSTPPSRPPRDAGVTRPANRAKSRLPAHPLSDDYEDFLPSHDGDRAVSCSRFGRLHGFSEKTEALWLQACKSKRLKHYADSFDVLGEGRYWQQGRVKVRFVLYSAGREEFLRFFWHLRYVYACGRPGCECARMPAKGQAITSSTPERELVGAPS
jgi:hypothetical protein